MSEDPLLLPPARFVLTRIGRPQLRSVDLPSQLGANHKGQVLL